MGDIRKWFMKSHDKGNGNPSKPAKPVSGPSGKPASAEIQPDKSVEEGQGSASRRKTSKYFASKNQKAENEEQKKEPLAKRKTLEDIDSPVKTKPSKKIHKVDDDDDNDDDLVFSTSRKKLVGATPKKKLKSGSGEGVSQKSMTVEESDEEEEKITELQTKKSGGRGLGGRDSSAAPAGGRSRGGRDSSAAPAGGRGRGSGRGGFMNFGDRKDPPHKGEKEVPEGATDCLAGLTFVISGTLDSLEREEAENLIKRHGGRVTGSVSKKTNYLLCDEDIEGKKSSKAKELGTAFLTEDGLFDLIRASNKKKVLSPGKSQRSMDEDVKFLPKKSPQKVESKKEGKENSAGTNVTHKGLTDVTSPALQRSGNIERSSLTWTEKYRPKVPNDIVGNPSLVKQLHDWLAHWNENFLDTGNKRKGKKLNDSGNKKAVLLSGTPGIGKTTSARLACQMLGFQAIEVNASDNRGKADAKIEKGIGGSNANSVKELVSNVALNVSMDWSKHPKTALIMDEVDGMSAGDRGGVADLIASIKISKIPIICICNDRYSQKLKSLVNYCLLLSFRKPTKQQMAKRLMQVAKAEGLQVNEIALEELAERVNGDMRMAINQLQYMSLSLSVIKYEDIHQRLLSSAKDEDISPFTAVDKLFSFNSSKLRMDERIGLSMSDPDLVPLLIQENYLNYRSNLAGKDDNGIKRMNYIARAAESIADGDIINVQIRRYRQWQLSQSASLASCIIPAALLHGQREILEQGERNYNRFGGWLGKNSTMGKNLRLLEDLHVHVLASRESSSGRETIRVEYLSLFLKQLTEPLRTLPKDEAVQKVVEFMNYYSISQEDYDTIVELSKFRGHPNPLDGIQPAVKAALTRAYKEGSKTRMVRAADLITLPGIKKAPKKRIAAILEPAEEVLGDGDANKLIDSEEEIASDTESLDDGSKAEKLQFELQSLNSKGTKVQLELKGKGNSDTKKSGGRGKGGSKASSGKKGGNESGSGRGSAPTAKRKR